MSYQSEKKERFLLERPLTQKTYVQIKMWLIRMRSWDSEISACAILLTKPSTITDIGHLIDTKSNQPKPVDGNLNALAFELSSMNIPISYWFDTAAKTYLPSRTRSYCKAIAE